MFVISDLMDMGNAHECILGLKEISKIDDDDPYSLSPEEHFDE